MSCTLKKIMNFYKFCKDLLSLIGLGQKTVEISSKISMREPKKESHPSDHILNAGYCPLGRLPSWYRRNDEDSVKKNLRANRYLSIQEKRIKMAIVQKDYNKAVLIWLMLFKTSKTYQIALINRTYKNWYFEMQKEQADRLFIETMNKMRRFSLWLLLRRFYVIKNKIDRNRNGAVYMGELREGEKLRPIGAPDYPSRVISKSFNDLIYAIFWDKFAVHQHGYRRHRGTFSALYGIISYLRNHKDYVIYEFDFKSFFNFVRPSWVYRTLLGRNKYLAEIIARVLIQVEYKFKEVHEEKELWFDKKVEHNGKIVPHIIRRGLPQGLSLSPLLATMVLELFKPPKGLFMYADDGLFIGTSEAVKKFKKWLQDVELTGAETEPTKTGEVKQGTFKFLNCIIDREQETILLPDGVVYSWWKKGLKDDLRKHSPLIYAGKKEEVWSWNIHQDSYLGRFKAVDGLGILRLTLIFLNSVIYNRPYQGYRFFWGIGVVDIIASSSWCIGTLLDHSPGFNLKGIKPFTNRSFITGNKYGNWEMEKSTRWNPYIEAIYENHIMAFARKELPGWNNIFTNIFP
jgi:hypothetical protein